MALVVLIVGLVMAIAGLLTLGFGIPIKEFSFGNTLIVAGAVGLGSGVIVIALGLALRELRRIARLLQDREAAPPRTLDVRSLGPREAQLTRHASGVAADDAPPATPTSPSAGALPSSADDAEPGSAPSLPPWTQEPRRTPAPARVGGPEPFALGPASAPQPVQVEPEPEPEPVSAPEPAKPSLAARFGFPSRRESDGAPVDWKRPPQSARAPHGDDNLDRAHPAPDDHMPDPASAEPPRRDFDMVWPASPRERPGVPRPQAPMGASPGGHTQPQPEAEAPAPSDQVVSILKSGTVDGMAYRLYSDGSIEAQLPEGSVRFRSIDDLRSHLEQRNA